MSDGTAVAPEQHQETVQTQEDLQREHLQRAPDDIDAELEALKAQMGQAATPAAKADGQQQATTPTPEAQPAQPQPTPTATTATTPAQPAATQPQATQPPQMVPAPVVVAMRRQMQQLGAQVLTLQGQNQALTDMLNRQPATASQPGQDLGQQEADPVAELEAQREALAKRFDDGEISMAEFVRADTKMQREIVRAEAAALIPQQANQPAHEDLYLETATTQIVEKYPILSQLTAQDLEPFVPLAYQQAQREGRPIQPGALGTLELRQRIGQLATTFYGGQQPAPAQATTQQTAQPAPQQQQFQGLSPQAQARDAKLQMAASMPPDVSQLGSGATQTPGSSDVEMAKRLNAMETDDERLALLQSQPQMRNRLYGRT